MQPDHDKALLGPWMPPCLRRRVEVRHLYAGVLVLAPSVELPFLIVTPLQFPGSDDEGSPRKGRDPREHQLECWLLLRSGWTRAWWERYDPSGLASIESGSK